MEAFLNNVPKDLSEESLTIELTATMKNLGIEDWTCEKPRKVSRAWVTFLNAEDGAKFLVRHGKLNMPAPPGAYKTTPKTPEKTKPEAHAGAGTSTVTGSGAGAGAGVGAGAATPIIRPKALAKLFLLKTPVYVQRSDRAVDEHTISHLKQLQHKKLRKKDSQIRDRSAPDVTYRTTRIACGKLYFKGHNDTLTFGQQSSSACDLVKFGQKFAIVTTAALNRMYISYKTMQDFVVDYRDNSFTMVLSEPPRFYSPTMNDNAPHASWLRRSSLSDWRDHQKYVANCLVYRIWLVEHDFDKIVANLKSRDLFMVTRHSTPVDDHPEPYKFDVTTCMSAFDGKIAQAGSLPRNLPFCLLFQVQALVWNDYLHPRAGSDMLNEMQVISQRAFLQGKRCPFTTDSMKSLFHTIPFPYPGLEPSELDVSELLQSVIAKEASYREQDRAPDAYGAKIAEQHVWVLKATVTPTKILLSGPDAETKNRVLRMFADSTDYFLRVTFADEDGSDLAFSPAISNDIVYDRYLMILEQGMKIAGRKFEFLGFSHSSLRSHSAWFSASFVDQNMKRQSYDSILASLGDFQEIRTPAKCAARIGQAFSETLYAVPLQNINIRYIEDVKSADGSRVFSDGVGTMSQQALTVIREQLPKALKHTTCIQIRLAGIKGMLSLDTRLRGNTIYVRKESMMKFPSKDFFELGICDVASKPLRLVLNRQLIKILEDMGTRDSWFLRLQNKALHFLRGVTANAANTSTFLEYQATGTIIGLPSFIKALNSLGIDYRRDSFLKSVVDHVVLRELRLLKHKARIPVDKGVTLFGVMDETGFLQEGEVYVTYDAEAARGYKTIDGSLRDGLVIVTRSPALHPGDIQVAEMKTPPQGHPLRDLRNCIVFSSFGERDLPSQLSGGDLDGDKYSIIWDQDAIPYQRFHPADYPRVVPEPLDREVTRKDIAEFFVNFMRTDVLGLIATRHQIYADVKDRGTADPDCIKLAELASTAVDYSKTGIPVPVRSIPRAPRTRPDFLAPAPPVKLYHVNQSDHLDGPDAMDEEEEDDEGDHGMGRAKYRYHLSDKILGRLYRDIDEKKIWKDDVHRKTYPRTASIWKELISHVERTLRTLGLDHKVNADLSMEQAWKLRKLYESTVLDNMWHFSENPRTHISEVEAFCGTIFNKSGSQTRRQRDSSIKLKEAMDEAMTWIANLLRMDDDDDDSDDSNEDGESDDSDAPIRLLSIVKSRQTVQLCLACLKVGDVNTEKESARHNATPLESFRVVAACRLLRALDELRRPRIAALGPYV